MGLEHLLQDANQTREVCAVVGPALATRSLKDFLELCLATEISPVNEQPEQTTSVIGSPQGRPRVGTYFWKPGDKQVWMFSNSGPTFYLCVSFLCLFFPLLCSFPSPRNIGWSDLWLQISVPPTSHKQGWHTSFDLCVYP